MLHFTEQEMERGDYERDCMQDAKDFEIACELESLDQLNRERAEKNLPPLTYREFVATAHH